MNNAVCNTYPTIISVISLSFEACKHIRAHLSVQHVCFTISTMHATCSLSTSRRLMHFVCYNGCKIQCKIAAEVASRGGGGGGDGDSSATKIQQQKNARTYIVYSAI